MFMHEIYVCIVQCSCMSYIYCTVLILCVYISPLHSEMGRDTELFKAAQTGNIDFLEKVFSAYLAVERGKDAAPGKGKVKKQQSMSR